MTLNRHYRATEQKGEYTSKICAHHFTGSSAKGTGFSSLVLLFFHTTKQVHLNSITICHLGSQLAHYIYLALLTSIVFLDLYIDIS